ncbi:GspH/FimT family pseudopilin [Gammaproteobacteria bacterium]|nr:GspH/FimT family pseudopilin [Gammaproteobacteria bacterium]
MDNRSRTDGFTLVEMLTTMAVLVVVASLAMPSLSEWRDRRHGEQAIERGFELLRHARALAMASRQPVFACVTDGDSCLRQGHTLQLSQADQVIEQIRLPDRYRYQGNRDQWRFNPDGQAWPVGSLTLCGDAERLPSAKMTIIHTGRTRIVASRDRLSTCY